MPVPGRTSRQPRLWAAGGLLLSVALVAALLAAARGGGGRAGGAGDAAGDGLPHTTVEVSPSGCGGPRLPSPGTT